MIKLLTVLLLTISFNSFANTNLNEKNDQLEIKNTVQISDLSSLSMGIEAISAAEKAQQTAEEANEISLRQLEYNNEIKKIKLEIEELKLEINNLKN